MNIKYTIEFLDYWHSSSGLSAGTKHDSLVLKDSDNLPYITGKTIKGMARDMAMEMGDCAFINRCFGGSTDENDPCYDANAKNREGACYFSNATLEESTAQEIIAHKLQDRLYDEIASTQIGDKGIAKDNSLREIEVVIPMSLYGEIHDIPSDDREKMQTVLKMIKRLGLNRNRGLGRCQITIKESR